MFIAVLLTTLGALFYLSIRHWMQHRRLTAKRAQKILDEVEELMVMGKWDEAKNSLLPLLHYPKALPRSALYYVQILRKMRAFDEALHLASYYALRHPEEPSFRLEEGKILLELGRADEALAAFKSCQAILRTESDIHVLALALLKGGHPEQSWALIEKRLEKSQNRELIALGAEALLFLKNYTQAIALFSQALSLGYRPHHLMGKLALAYRKQGNLSEAEKIYCSLLEKDPGDVEATLGLGRCMEERGHFQKAFLIYQSTHAWKKKDPRLIKQAAFCALYTRRYAYAERYFYELTKTHTPPSPTILSYYGFSLECQKKWQEAEQVYLETIKRYPAEPNGYRGAAWLFGVGLTTIVTAEEGVNYAHIALKLLADSTSWEILSAVFARVGQFEKAYQIQEGLLASEKDQKNRGRIAEALRQLRKNAPLEDGHVARSLVA